VCGVGYPLLNITEKIRNQILKVKSRELHGESHEERTAKSGIWNVAGVNKFPSFMSFVLNPFVLRPFDWIQQLGSRRADCVVLVAIAKVA
jgi:hypothetical protein